VNAVEMNLAEIPSKETLSSSYYASMNSSKRDISRVIEEKMDINVSESLVRPFFFLNP
jgi:hypothetical protein